MVKIAVLEKDLAAAQKKLSELEERREILHRSHGAAVSERREHFLADTNIDSKALVEAEQQSVACREHFVWCRGRFACRPQQNFRADHNAGHGA